MGYFEIESFEAARANYPRFRDLHPRQGVDHGNHQDYAIDWDWFENRINRQFRNPAQDDHRLDWRERSEDNTIDYTSWSVSRIVVAQWGWLDNHACSCGLSRLENQNTEPLLGSTASRYHDEYHAFANTLLTLNDTIKYQISWRNSDGLGDDIQPHMFINDMRVQVDSRFIRGHRFFNKSPKHKVYKERAQRLLSDNTFLVFFILADETGTECNVVQATISTKVSHSQSGEYSYAMADDMNESMSPFYGYYNEMAYDPYKDVIYNPHSFSSVRQYKECKICLGKFDKNYMAFMIDMVSSSNRYSACFLCVTTHTAGYNSLVEAFVRLPNRIESDSTEMSRYWDIQHDMQNTPEQTLIPFWRRLPTNRGTSHYQWEDVSDFENRNRSAAIGTLDEHGNSIPIELSLEARKLLSWVADHDPLYTPERGAESSVGHIGSVFDWFEIDEGYVDRIQHFHQLYDGGVCIDEDYDRWVYGTDYYQVDHDGTGRISYGDENNETPYGEALLLSIYRPDQWETYLAQRSSRWQRASANPQRNQRIIVVHNAIHIDKHGLPGMELDKKEYNFTFPLWHVAMGRENNSRLLKPIGQVQWSNPAALTLEQQRRQDDVVRNAQIMSDSEVKLHQLNAFGPFYGMELEIVARREVANHQIENALNTHHRLIELFHPAWAESSYQTQKVQLAYRVKDSSVDSGSQWGHEIVTQPHTLEAFQNVPSEFYDSLRNNYVAMYKEGGSREFGLGIHIHIDHDNFSTGHLWAFLDYFYRIHHEVAQDEIAWDDTVLGMVAQRPSGQWAYWNLPRHNRRSRVITDLDSVIGLTAIRRCIDGASTQNYRKYDAINFEKPGTIELRYFNSTTVKDRLLARLEFVDAVYKMTYELSEELGFYNTYNGEPNDTYRQFFKGLTVDTWNDRLWYFILSTRDNRNKYSNLIKLGKQRRAFNLDRLFAEPSVNHEVRDHIDLLELITEEGGIH